MNSKRPRIAFTSLVILAVTLVSCNDLTAPQFGFVQIAVTTTGGDPDEHFEVVSDTIKLSVAGNSVVTHQVPAGRQSFELRDVAENCTVQGSSIASVDVAKDQTMQVVFKVTCDATGISVQAHTTGAYFPAAYQVVIPSLPVITLTTNGIQSVSRLAAGRYQVTLHVGFANCAVAGDSVASADVVNRHMTTVLFEVNCISTPQTGVIAFTNYADSKLYVMNADGSTQIELNRGFQPSWSRSGSQLVYSTTECDYYGYFCHGSLALVDPSNRQVTLLPAANFGVQPAWSPVEDVIAYVNANTNQLMMLNMSTSVVTAIALPSNVIAFRPSWSPDGKQLVAQCYIPGYNTQLCIFNRDGSIFKTLDVGASFGTGDPSWSPDGLQIAFSRFGGQSTVAVVNADGTDVRSLAPGSDPSWSPDGRQIIFTGQNGLFVMNADGSAVQRLTTGGHAEPAWRR